MKGATGKSFAIDTINTLVGKMTFCNDSDHASNTVTRHSRTGFIIFLNSSPIYWTSKKQTSGDTSSFGSEFCAMKQATEYLRGLRYKLMVNGILIDEPAFVFGYNQSVLANTTKPESQLKKKTQSITYNSAPRRLAVLNTTQLLIVVLVL